MRRHRAVFTIVQNEAVFLPVWLKYYSKSFEPNDIYILDHDSTDGCTDNLTGIANVIKVHHSWMHDHRWLCQKAKDFQLKLLFGHKNVLYTDVDEIIIPNPMRYGSLFEYIKIAKKSKVCCSGFDVVHDYPAEPPIDFNRPLLAQRTYFYQSRHSCKPLLGKIPYKWKPGFHSAGKIKIDPELLLIHLHRLDRDLCLRRHQLKASGRWTRHDIDRGSGAHNLIVEPKAFDEWFVANRKNWLPIPDSLKSVV